MYFQWDGDINEEFFKELTNFINVAPEDEHNYFYFSSGGGNVPIALAALDMLERSDKHIAIIAYDALFSAAFHLFYKRRGPKAIMNTCIGGIHQRYGHGRINADGKLKTDEGTEPFTKQGQSYTKEDFNWLKKLGLTESELADFKKGKDLYFNYTRLTNLLKNQINDKGTKGKNCTATKRTSSSKSGGSEKRAGKAGVHSSTGRGGAGSSKK